MITPPRRHPLPVMGRQGSNFRSIQRFQVMNSDLSLAPENNIPPIGGIMAFIDGALRELTDDGGYINPWNDEDALAGTLAQSMPADDGGHIAYADNLGNATLDDGKPAHTVILQSSVAAIARALAGGLISGGYTNLNLRHIQRGGKNAQVANLAAAITPPLQGWLVRFGVPAPAWIRTATIEKADIWVGHRQDGRHDFSIGMLHWGVRT